MARQPSGWLGLVLMIALATMAACNLSDPLGDKPPGGGDCESDDDCGNGECVESGATMVCECDDLFTGDNCDACVDGRTLNDEGECVEEDIEPDMGPIDEPCLDVTPDPVEFGMIELGRAAVLSATITNCSEGFDLDVEEVATSGGVFELVSVDPELPATLEPGATATARVRFTPDSTDPATGQLDVTAGDLSASVGLTGQGQGEECFDATAGGQTMRTNFATTVAAAPYETVMLQVQPSDGGDADTLTNHQWSVTAQPMGSTTRLSPDNMAAAPTLFLDSLGVYTVEVTAENAEGLPTCDPAVVTINVTIDATIWVEITWDTPGDPDQTDNMGADIDLHFMHPNGTWNTAPLDLHDGNPMVDWGATGPANDPQLVRSDSDGLGPEIVILNDPEMLNYRTGAYGANPNGFGVSDVTMRVYLNGNLSYEGTQAVNLREFWFVGGIDAANQSFAPVETITIGFP